MKALKSFVLAATVLAAQLGTAATIFSENFDAATPGTALTALGSSSWTAFFQAPGATTGDEGAATVEAGNGGNVAKVTRTYSTAAGFGVNAPLFFSPGKNLMYSSGTISFDVSGSRIDGVNGGWWIKLADLAPTTIDAFQTSGATVAGVDAWALNFRSNTNVNNRKVQFASDTTTPAATDWAINTMYHVVMNFDVTANTCDAVITVAGTGAPYHTFAAKARKAAFTSPGIGCIIFNPSGGPGFTGDMQVDNVVFSSDATPVSTVADWNQY